MRLQITFYVPFAEFFFVVIDGTYYIIELFFCDTFEFLNQTSVIFIYSYKILIGKGDRSNLLRSNNV